MTNLLGPGFRRGASRRLLVPSRPTQRTQFPGGELPPFANRESLQLQWTHLNAAKLPDGMVDPIHHATNLTIPPLSKGDEQSRTFTVATQDDKVALRGPGGLAGLPVHEVETTAHLVEGLVLHAPLDRDVVSLVDTEPWVGETIGKISIVGQQEQPGTLQVESADAEEAAAGGMVDEIDRQFPTLGILGGADEAFRLEQHDVMVATPLLDLATMYLDGVGLGIDETWQALDDVAVHGDRALLDQCFGGSSRCDTGIGQDLLDPDSIVLGTFWGTGWARHSDHCIEPAVRPQSGAAMIDNLRKTIDWLRLAVTEPVGQLTSMQRSIRRGIEVLRYCTKHLGEDQAPVLAAALSFRVLFGLVPMLVVATVVTRSVLQERFPAFVRSVIEELGLADVRLAPTATEAADDLGSWLEGLVANASAVNLAALGWVGFGVVAFSAMWVLVTIENGFNHIYRAPSGRSWFRRLLIYWFLLTFPTALLGVVPAITSELSTLAAVLPDWPWLVQLLDLATSTAVIWLLLLMAYLWVPNTRVEARPAMIGALVAAILIEAAKNLLGVYTTHALTLNRLYGSLGLIPLFMFWMYLMWVFVLFGLEVSTIIQTLRGRGVEVLSTEDRHEGLIDPAIALAVLREAGHAFKDGRPVRIDAIASDLGLDPALARALLEGLERQGLLSRLERSDEFQLARPLEDIDPAEALAIGFKLADGGGGRSDPLLESLRSAQTQAATKLRFGMPDGS